jgi:hypothetical protein
MLPRTRKTLRMNAAVNSSADSCDCEPFVYVPAWWSSFLFQLVSPRQLAVYTYIAMLGVPDGISRPTVRQIQDDMGLSSDSVVFDALRSLEDLALIRRLRNAVVTGQNAYVRPACETTLIKLLEMERIDHRLRPVNDGAQPKSADVTELARDGLRNLLGDAYNEYAAKPESERRTFLLAALRQSQSGRVRKPGSCVCERS